MHSLTVANDNAPRLQAHYWQAVEHYPASNPLLMTADDHCLQWIRKQRGLCLYCPHPAQRYDLSCCFGREIWLLYRQKAKCVCTCTCTLTLAYTLQANGAAHIALLPLALSGETCHESTPPPTSLIFQGSHKPMPGKPRYYLTSTQHVIYLRIYYQAC